MSPEEKEEILALFKSGMQQKEIAKKFKRSPSAVNFFLNHRNDEKIKELQTSELSSLPDTVMFSHLDYYKF